MKAMVMRAFGPAEVLRLEDVPMPEPGPGEVVVQVKAVSVNRTLDLVVRAGNYVRTVALPHVLGTDPSGIVVAVGGGVTDRAVGDRVTCWLRVREATPRTGPSLLGVDVWGGYAEYVRVPARTTFRVPDTLGFAAATVIARHAPMAFGLLRDTGKVQAGEWVLVMGAAGGLGFLGVQVAKALGARVIAAAGADDRVAIAMTAGADAGIDYRAQDLTAEVRRITAGRGADVVFENIGDPDLFPRALKSLARGGRLVTAGSHGGGLVPLDVSFLYLNNISVIGSTHQRTSDIEPSLAAAAVGALQMRVDRIMPLAEAAAAHHLVAGRGGVGKIILEP